ncbi:hypothetical protein Q4519_06125 [Motilimonas sp. 1_MG-2023]|uniref:hypothetical protein n=1 Tax=Motilimonas sp. 1_MG-2023 TaxID=3062672 RepID=UPI0026E1F013|nr:hypothetical protein [Motilimonas sp. 1_MG-2023]MDO6525257.1 hypothetical protein [Motilimonas sp. 1_MG-2023]
MTDFTETMRRKGKAEEDIYFARLDQQLIDAKHQKQDLEQQERALPSGQPDLFEWVKK